MSLFAIADTHLSFGTNKPMDIFDGWEGYTKDLEKNWRNLVSQGDTTVIAGDISWGMSLEEAKLDFEFLHNLPGEKVILKGNHDYWWSTRRKMENFFEANGFDSIKIIHNSAEVVGEYAVCGTRGWFYDAEDEANMKVLSREVGRLNMSIDLAEKTGKEPIVYLHYPPILGDAVCGEIMDVLIKRNIKRCYYGHIHGSMATVLGKTGYHFHSGIKFRLISCDALNFTPLKIS